MNIEEMKQHIKAAGGQGFAIADLPKAKQEEIAHSLPQLWKDIEAAGSLL